MPRLRSLLCLGLLVTTACGKEDAGDDLPAGAFTSGPDDNGEVDVGEPTTTGASVTTDDPSATSTTTEGPADSSGTPIDLNHGEHVLPIWIESCGTTGCHSADAPAAGLDLVSEGVYTRICDGFHGFSGMPYIDCGGLDPQNSYIFRKLEGTHLEGISGGNGGPMPPTGALSDAELTLIETWITDGAVE